MKRVTFTVSALVPDDCSDDVLDSHAVTQLDYGNFPGVLRKGRDAAAAEPLSANPYDRLADHARWAAWNRGWIIETAAARR